MRLLCDCLIKISSNSTSIEMIRRGGGGGVPSVAFQTLTTDSIEKGPIVRSLEQERGKHKQIV